MEVAPLVDLSWMTSSNHMSVVYFTIGNVSLTCNHNIVEQLLSLVSEGCLRVQILLVPDFWQSKLVTCRLVHAAWSPETCPGFVLKRSGTEQRLAAGQHLPRLMVHQPFLVAGTLWLNDINVFSESQESASKITNLCYSINISSCFMNLTELPKKGKLLLCVLISPNQLYFSIDPLYFSFDP